MNKDLILAYFDAQYTVLSYMMDYTKMMINLYQEEDISQENVVQIYPINRY